MKIYNTLTRKKEEFKPLISGKVSMYVCGPTVYNYIHIGNARSAVSFDTIRRYLEYRGFEVNYVSNFTDVDDKMINAAKEQGISVSELAKRFINAYLEDTRALNIKPANKYPRATEEIDEIISFIKKLIAQGYAYEKAGSVYYRTKKFKDYGQLSGQDIASLEVGASQHVTKQEQEDKDDPLDFALWKKQKTSSEIAWTSPWGKGRPGWHIECSVMAIKYLSETIDIHGGGQDLEFPHHENEIAQSQALTGKKFANYWLHNGLVTVGQEQEKMSKSQHNFVTVHELLKTVPAVVLRFFLASVHYRKQINYSKENLQQARNILNRFKNTLERLNYRLSDQTTTLHSEKLCQAGQQAQINFVAAMDDDFNVQNALKAVYDLLPVINDNLDLPQSDKESLRHLKQSLKTWLGIFGVDFEKLLFNQENEASEKINLLITQRNQARENKDWEKSDRLRDELKTLGVSLKDTPQGTRWTYDKG